MSRSKADKKPAKSAAIDRGESTILMEPVQLSMESRHKDELMDLVVELVSASSGFRSSLPPLVVKALSNLVRAMNCYYSNLIEGHDTHPIDIERALINQYDHDVEQRNLQIEAKAHIVVQSWIDDGGLTGRVTTADSICDIHRRFCELLPPELLFVTNEQMGKRLPVIPGALRAHDVKVGPHTPISPGAVPRFLNRFDEVFNDLGKLQTILSVGAAHHRLTWIHPFLDGNGRVARLMSHATLLEELDTGGIWSVARGLARQENRYKQLLANCDLPRRNDLDGRGHLSEEALVEFTKFFLETCLDQVRFMEQLVQPARLRERILAWAQYETGIGQLPAKAGQILEAVLYRGELPRGEVHELLGVSERQSRRIVSALFDYKVLVSESTRAPLHLAFPAALASSWMPGLFPERKL